jgi:F0F1-type ATP synthase assembly protein I
MTEVMALTPDQQPTDSHEPNSPELRKVKKYSTQTALALELPFTIVGAVLVGGLIGYFVDHWLHTHFIFIIVFGGLGFAGGLREVLRRLSQSEK